MKTTNNANLNKLMNKKSNKGVVESMDQLNNKVSQEVLESVYNGTCDLRTLLNITEEEIDMTKCEFPIKTMQLIYAAGSKVGEVTIDGQNMYMIDVTTEEGFAAFKDGLKPLKSNKAHKPYESVWILGYNMFKQFNFATGQFYVYYVVTNEEMRMLKERIEAMSKDKMTVEDAQKLQADLPPFVRAWQESSIDVSKDKDKVFDIPMNKIIGKTRTLSQLTKKYREAIDFGFDKVKKAKHDGKIVPNFAYANALVEAANPVVDLMGHVNIALQETTVEKLNGTIKSLYAKANNDLYAPFLNDAQISKDLAFFIKSIYRICYASIDDEYDQISEEKYAELRNVIYTAALNYGVDREDVIKVAIATAMTSVYKDKDNNIVTKDANVNKFRMFPISNIFPNELVYTLADQPQYNTYNPQETISIITRNIEDNEEITFVNGVSEDGCIELYDTTFNGTLVEYEGNLIEFIDVFEFNVSNALLVTDDTFRKGATRDEILRLKTGDKAALDKGEFFDELHQELTAVNITGANANVIKTAYADNNVFLSKFVANYAVVKGETAVRDIVTYKPENGTQQLFLVLV